MSPRKVYAFLNAEMRPKQVLVEDLAFVKEELTGLDQEVKQMMKDNDESKTKLAN